MYPLAKQPVLYGNRIQRPILRFEDGGRKDSGIWQKDSSDISPETDSIIRTSVLAEYITTQTNARKADLYKKYFEIFQGLPRDHLNQTKQKIWQEELGFDLKYDSKSLWNGWQSHHMNLPDIPTIHHRIGDCIICTAFHAMILIQGEILDVENRTQFEYSHNQDGSVKEYRWRSCHEGWKFPE